MHCVAIYCSLLCYHDARLTCYWHGRDENGKYYTISLAFQACVLTIIPHMLPDVTMLPNCFVSMQLLAWEVSADYYSRPPGIVSILMLTHRQWPYMYIPRVGSTTIQHVASTGSLLQQPVLLWVWWKWEILRLEWEFLAFWASVLTISPPVLPDVIMLPMPTCLNKTVTNKQSHAAIVLCLKKGSQNTCVGLQRAHKN